MSRTLMVFLSFLIPIFLEAQVPSSFQATYNALSSQVASFDAAVKTGYDGTPFPFLPTPGLLSASSDNYTSLLNSTYYTYNITPALNSFQALGAKAVDVHINFPILYQPFYDSTGNSAQYEQFVSFYQQLAQDVHSRGLKLVVECVAGSPVPGTQISTFQTYMASLSWTNYMAGRAQNALNVAQLIQPDYMSVVTEPDTEASTASQPTAGTLTGGTQLLQTILAALQTGGVTTVQIGAGTGTWMSSYTTWVANFLAQPINYLDMHVISAINSDLTNSITGAQMALAAGKQVGVTEAWIAKIAAPGSTATPDSLNPFSFWAPLDAAFLKSMVDLANADHLTFLAPSWTTYFFSYLSYDTYGTLPPATLLPDAYAAAGTANQAGATTATAKAWEAAVLPAPDKTAPSVPGTPYATSTGFNGFQLAWAASTDNVGVAGYKLFRNGAMLVSVNGLSYSDLSCTPGDTYTYRLVAFDASGNKSAPSASFVGTTINNVPPSAPANLAVVSVTNNSVTLQWSASTGSPATYRVLKGTSPTSLTNHAIVTSTSYVDSVAPNGTYYYEVEATNVNGFTSGPSNEVSATTN